ncbi:T9SS type B sorting domain-containing protein [Sinomicrobium soli]|uniref:T9SS type B sorting domain-containing protein n=1 Tax=Sinomicrobium sp. N-1-3-6 TaxID=2219864 RepID=UPI000DCC2FA9|nr:gliding motility-associated C-terminal domain-containing protein [Sinomicrobium sp. N-1-3-6]RAV28963.1 hypothetical protein DN748_11280 [Sinomicrobium sp. N-1-3-6]
MNISIKNLVPLFILLLFSTFSSAQIYVSPTGTGDGSSWEQASSLPDAVSDAPSGATLWLREGTYTVASTIVINRTMEILGGFSGSGNQRDPAAYPSIIDGQNIVYMIRTGNSTNNTLFDGISFINGYADIGTDVNDVKGGALYIQGNGTRINNCIFRNNTSENRIGSGAIYLWSVDNIVIENSLFENNRVLQNDMWEAGNIGGGAIHIRFGTNNRVENCRFINNSSYYPGGAIFAWGENAQIIDCHFENNQSNDNGGAIYVNFDSTNIYGSVFRSNISEEDGGAIFFKGDPSTVTNSTFTQNHAVNGGAISNSTELSIFNSSFSQNISSDHGGAIFNRQKLSVSNSLFDKNTTATIGGAIYSGEELYVTNSTFVSNEKTAIVHPSRESSEYYTYQTHIFNSVFFDNTAGTINGTGLWPDVDRDSNNPDQSEKDFRRNIFQENTNGSNNLTGTDPLFQDFTGGDFSLQSGSPAVDYGRNNLYTTVKGNGPAADEDLAGNDRLFGTYVDAGAYELQSASTLPPPDCTTLSGPLNGDTDVEVTSTIQWNAVADADGYYISIGTSPGATDIENNLDVGNTTTYTPTADFPENTIIFVTIVPYNTAGDATGCPEESFTTETLATAPDCTAITSPADGATNVGINTNITWNAIADADGYYISIGTTSGGTDIVDNEDVSGTSYNPTADFPEDTVIYVSVISYNSEGNATGCTEISFTTETLTTAPDCTAITSPADGATNVGINTNITWNAIADADGYYISIGTTSGGTDIVDNEDVSGTSYNPTADFPEDTVIYVSVIPYNSVGNATGCSGISFTTETLATAPDCTVITSPADGATNVGINTNITWNAVADANGYYVSIGTTAGGTDIVDNADVSGTSYNPTADFPEDTVVYVSVVPYNSVGNATGCSEISFTTETLATAPDCTVITSPTDGATDVGINTNITWNAIADADGYYISIGTTAGGTDIVDNEDVSSTSYNPTADFPEDTVIYVSVISYNSAGNATGCSGISFTTETLATVPDCTVITSPTDGATDVSINTNITWNAIADADGYYISIGTTSGGTDIVDNEDVNGTTYNLTADFPEDTVIYVSVIPYNSVGNATGCTEISFTTETLATVPDCTVITSPTDGATDVSINTNITWNAIADADGYYISIGTTSGGTDIVDNEDVSGTTYNLTADFPEDTVIYVSVIPYNSAGEATGCPGISFTTETGNSVIADETKYGFSPNGDGINDVWIIHGIESYPGNIVSVYNRWGDMVFRVRGYDNRTNVFKGRANRLTTLGAGELPSGTYFFQIENVPENHHFKKLKGFLVLKR